MLTFATRTCHPDGDARRDTSLAADAHRVAERRWRRAHQRSAHPKVQADPSRRENQRTLRICIALLLLFPVLMLELVPVLGSAAVAGIVIGALYVTFLAMRPSSGPRS